MSSLLGGVPLRADANPSSSRNVERVGLDRVLARRSLADQPIGEERLERRSERAHRWPPKRASSRPAASVISSGTADRYQYVSDGATWPR